VRWLDDTAKFIFGASIGDRIADEIFRRLRQAGEVGVSRTDISHNFGRHVEAGKIGAALAVLAKKGLAGGEMVASGGRPVEVWRVAKHAN
jgi:hypothetical protein